MYNGKYFLRDNVDENGCLLFSAKKIYHDLSKSMGSLIVVVVKSWGISEGSSFVQNSENRGSAFWTIGYILWVATPTKTALVVIIGKMLIMLSCLLVAHFDRIELKLNTRSLYLSRIGDWNIVLWRLAVFRTTSGLTLSRSWLAPRASGVFVAFLLLFFTYKLLLRFF